MVPVVLSHGVDAQTKTMQRLSLPIKHSEATSSIISIIRLAIQVCLFWKKTNDLFESLHNKVMTLKAKVKDNSQDQGLRLQRTVA